MSAAEASLELVPDPTSPRKARRFIATTLREWGCEQVVDVAKLLVTEVVTNAVRYVHSRAVLSARYDGDRLEVRVRDESDTVPTLRPVDPEDQSGRGLMLVNALADQWGVEPSAHGGKTVYFALDC